MTYGGLKSLITGLLVGDNVIPKDDAVMNHYYLMHLI